MAKRVTGRQHHDELYDEIERIARHLVDAFNIERALAKHMSPDGEYERRIDPDILIGRAGALYDAAQELKFLRKLRGSLRTVTD